MNALQWVSMARAFVILFGGIAVGLGWATQSDIDALSNPETLTTIVGGIAAAVAMFYGWRARRASAVSSAAVKLDPQGTMDKAAATHPSAVVQAAATVPGVESIVATQQIASSVPSDKVVARQS
jgi:hypothetical protein